MTNVNYPTPRRSRRILRTIELVISSISEHGQLAEGPAETLVISKHGARIHTNLTLLLGSVVRVRIPSTGAQADAIVTWVSRESSYEFGIELLNATEIWKET